MLRAPSGTKANVPWFMLKLVETPATMAPTLASHTQTHHMSRNTKSLDENDLYAQHTKKVSAFEEIQSQVESKNAAKAQWLGTATTNVVTSGTETTQIMREKTHHSLHRVVAPADVMITQHLHHHHTVDHGDQPMVHAR